MVSQSEVTMPKTPPKNQAASAYIDLRPQRPPDSLPRFKRRSCSRCNQLHTKCDMQAPTCSPCAKAAKLCRYRATTAIAFRHQHNPSIDEAFCAVEESQNHPFPPNQVWLPTPSTLFFSSEDERPIAPEETPRSPSRVDEDDPTTNTAALSPDNQAVILVPEPPQHSSLGLSTAVSRPVHVNNCTLNKPIKPLWPLQDKREVCLLQHFTNHLSLWFDYCDKDRHFRNIVVPATATHFVLLNAVLAISSKHLSLLYPETSRTGEADGYQGRCLQTFIPALANSEATGGFTTGILCAITMLLRLFEEMTVPTVDDTPYGHILDTKIFTLPKSPTDSNYSLCRACILVAIRQEIFISCVAQTSPPRLAHRCGIDRTFEPTSDFDWAWRIIVFTEDVLSFVYGEEPHNSAVWDELRTYLNRWMDKRPASFNPIWNSGSDHDDFPEITFANDFHLAGQQFAIICQLLLLSHDPRVSSLGRDGTIAAKAVEDEIRRLVRQICGIANSATEWPPAIVNAGTAIAMCGYLFYNHEEQERLLEILSKSEAHMGWSLLKQEEKLRTYWALHDKP